MAAPCRACSQGSAERQGFCVGNPKSHLSGLLRRGAGTGKSSVGRVAEAEACLGGNGGPLNAPEPAGDISDSLSIFETKPLWGSHSDPNYFLGIRFPTLDVRHSVTDNDVVSF
jgi:hypothetical protein